MLLVSSRSSCFVFRSSSVWLCVFAGLAVYSFNGASCKYQNVPGFPYLIIGLFALILEDFLVCMFVLFVSIVSGNSVISSVFIWFWLFWFWFSAIASIACSNCSSLILSTWSFRLFSPGVFSLIVFFLPRPICISGVKSKLISIPSTDVSAVGVLAHLSSVSVCVCSSSSSSSSESDCMDVWTNLPSVPRRFSSLLDRGFWNEFGNGLLIRFLCIFKATSEARGLIVCV